MSPRWFVLLAICLGCSEEARKEPSQQAGGSGGDAGGATGGYSPTGGGAPPGAGGSSPSGGKGQAGDAGSAATGGATTTGGSATATGGSATATGGSATATGGSAGATDGGTSGKAAIPFAEFTPEGDPIALPGVINASDIAWKPETDTYFLVLDRVAEFREYGPDFGEPVRTIAIVNGPVDAEGIAYLGRNGELDRFALGVEANDNVVIIFDLDPSATEVDMAEATLQIYEPSEAPSVANKGYEGVAFRPASGGEPAWLYACQEGEPDQVPIRVLRFPYLSDGPETLTYRDDSLEVQEPWNAMDQLGDVAGDLSSLYYDTDSETLLVLSDRGSTLLRVDPETGSILDQLALDRSPQYEGVTMAGPRRLVLVSEPNFIEVFSAP